LGAPEEIAKTVLFRASNDSWRGDE